MKEHTHLACIYTSRKDNSRTTMSSYHRRSRRKPSIYRSTTCNYNMQQAGHNQAPRIPKTFSKVFSKVFLYINGRISYLFLKREADHVIFSSSARIMIWANCMVAKPKGKIRQKLICFRLTLS